MSAGSAAWERVLDEVERDVLRTETLLSGALTDDAPPAPARPDSPAAPLHLAPAEIMLPTPAAGWLPAALAAPAPDLPALSDMPPVPAALLGRIVALQARIGALRGEIEAAIALLPMADAAPAERLVDGPVPAAPAPALALAPAQRVTLLGAASLALATSGSPTGPVAGPVAPRFVDRRL